MFGNTTTYQPMKANNLKNRCIRISFLIFLAFLFFYFLIHHFLSDVSVFDALKLPLNSFKLIDCLSLKYFRLIQAFKM